MVYDISYTRVFFDFPLLCEKYLNIGHYNGIMKFSKTELRLVSELPKHTVKEIADALGKSTKQIYRLTADLEKKGILERHRKKITASRTSFTPLLMQTIAEHPNLIDMLADSGLPVFLALVSEPKKPENGLTIKQLLRETKIKKSALYNKLDQAMRVGAVRKREDRFYFNHALWPKLGLFLIEYKQYYHTIDARIPLGSVIYYKTDKELVFSSEEKQDATLTGFSAYSDFGIQLRLLTNYYYLPKKKLSKRDVFLHSLYIADKDKDFRLILYAALFYAKFKEKLSGIKQSLLEDIQKSLAGTKKEGYPPLNEIKEKAEVYDIKI